MIWEYKEYSMGFLLGKNQLDDVPTMQKILKLRNKTKMSRKLMESMIWTRIVLEREFGE